jgi:sulfur dioxygenase
MEKATNPRLAGKSRDEFIALMNALDLPKPRAWTKPCPANQRSGLRQDSGCVTAATAAEWRAPGRRLRGRPDAADRHDWLQAGRAVLVDVRTDAEREWVGFVPGAVAVAWKQWPGMALNPEFDAQIAPAARGRPAADAAVPQRRALDRRRQRATELGLTAYNVLGGFEGDPDEHAQRGHQNGWRHAGLPWRQN